MEKKECRDCKLVKPLNEFANAGTINGKKYYRNLCKSCYTKFKSSRRTARFVWFEEYKKTLKCNRCGCDDYRVLEFHHVGKDKEFNIGDAKRSGYGKKRVLEEVKKCEVLCANCHRILHYEERKTVT